MGKLKEFYPSGHEGEHESDAYEPAIDFDLLDDEEIASLILSGKCCNQDVVDFYNNEWWDDKHG